jgi:hypothetical protein
MRSQKSEGRKQESGGKALWQIKIHGFESSPKRTGNIDKSEIRRSILQLLLSAF